MARGESVASLISGMAASMPLHPEEAMGKGEKEAIRQRSLNRDLAKQTPCKGGAGSDAR